MAVSNPFQTHTKLMLRQTNGIWRATFSVDDDSMWTMGSGVIYYGTSNSAALPRLKEVLDILDARKMDWQWPQGLTDEGDFIVSWAVDQNHNTLGVKHLIIKSAELTVGAYQNAIRALKTESSAVSVAAKGMMKSDYSHKFSKYSLDWQHLPGNRDWLVWGIATVADGDTIDVKVMGKGSALAAIPEFDKKSKVTIRFAGADTPEVKKEDQKYEDEGRNQKVAKKYQVPIETAYAVGNDAKAATKAMIENNGAFVIVDIDIKKNQAGNDEPKTDTYSRYIGMVYKSLYDPALGYPDPMSNDDWYVHVNRTLVASPSSYTWKDSNGRDRAIPLAAATGSYQYDLNDTKFDTILWKETVALDAELARQDLVSDAEKAQAETKKQVEAEIQRMRESNGRTVREIKSYIVTGDETLEAIAKNFRSQGIDVSIDVLVSINNIRKDENGKYILAKGQEIYIPIIKQIDASNTAQFRSTFGEIIDNTTDFFQPLDDRRDMATNYHVRIGDVQLVIPPLSIGVNQVSSIEKIKTLRTKSSMMAKAGSTHRTLTMQLYFHDLESINGYQVHLNDAVDDYYMDGLRPLIAQFKKTPFLPIVNEYVNEVLDIHEVILVNLSISTVPGFPHSMAATLTLAEFDPETYMPHVEFLDTQINYPMFRWFYQQPMLKSNASNPYRTYLAPVEGGLTNDFHFTLAKEEDLIARMDAAKDLRFMQSPIIFDDQVTQGKNLIGRLKRDGDRAKTMLIQYNNYKKVKERMGSKFPKSFSNSHAVFAEIYGENFKWGSGMNAFTPVEWSNDFTEGASAKSYFLIEIEGETNINNIPSGYKDTMGRKNAYEFHETDVPYLQEISKNGTNAETGIQAYHSSYKKLRDKAESTESSLRMDEYHIDDLWITQMNVTYENSYSMVQTQIASQPTYQYLGSQDPYISITMETDDRSAIMSLQHLIKTSDEYSMKYRYGITAGFVGFENQLSRLFGVTTVMIESCQINTVPSFPNRFQIQMTMCGFNKTQKRTESLNGFSAAQDKSKYDREITRDPTNADAIILETKMKDLELYPDLELPTYKELNKVLPYIGAGFDIYHNATGAKYVDPDFYVSTNWTFRSYFKQFKKKDNQDEKMGLMELKDFAGLTGKTNVTSGKFIELHQDSLEAMKSIDEMAKSYHIPDPEVIPGMTKDMPIYGPPWSGGDGGDAGEAGGGSEVKAWLGNRANIFKRPDSNLVLKWMGYKDEALSNDAQAAYGQVDKFLSNPSHLEIYQHLYNLIDKHFVAQGRCYDDRQALLEDGVTFNDAAKKVTYATVEDLARASYLWLKNSGDSRFANAPAQADGDALKFSDLNATAGMITRERIANYFKTKYQQESTWAQFRDSGIPVVPDGATSVGIGQMTLSIHARSIEDAQRLSWDWRYNMERSMQYYIEQWEKAMATTELQVRCRPWDWAIKWFNLPASTSLTEGPYWLKMVSIFQGNTDGANNKRPGAWYNSESSRYATPGNPENEDVFNYLQGTNTNVRNLIMDDIDEMKKALVNLSVSNHFRVSTPGWGLGVNPSERLTKAQMDEAFKDLSGDEIKARYVQAMEYETMRGSATTGGKSAVKDYKVYKHFQVVKKAVKANLLLNSDMPNALFRDMWTDVVEHDHRGRLLRAFPTFQMFIIDEGRWMANYKLWDNMYGFNAIQSIDVHKSRKIAADTAVIKMTNMYSNLTSRKLDEAYGDWSYSFWDNYVWGNPSDQLLKAREEIVSSMMLQTGARIHLRVGYGADATSLPVMFNGTITELDTEDIITIVAQGDGIELTNMISADPNETNDAGLFSKLLEPRDLLCRLMTSKGNWFRDVVNNESGGKLFKDHPLGIQHFGNPVKTPKPNGELKAVFGWYSEGADFGEGVQNIYSSNGENTFSQKRYANGKAIDSAFAVTADNWTDLSSWENFMNIRWTEDNGDEADVEMKLYGKTVWDVAQTLAYVSPDYIAAVHPFETRSTLFFGKPYYKIAYRYDSVYEWDEYAKIWKRTVTSEYRKPYQQFHYFSSDTDILSNRIKASEEGVYTNVIAMVEGKPTLMQMADEDIRFDKQKTKVVDTGLVGGFAPFQKWTSDKQGEFFAQSALRDYIKDMYKGTLTVMGDPTVKPHDMCYLADTLHDMNGSFLVKDVTHSFSMETGFITMISPDCVVVADDAGTIGQATWLNSAGIGVTSYFLGRKIAARSLRKLLTSSSMLGRGATWAENALGKSMMKLAASMPHDKNDLDYKRFKVQLKGYSNAGGDVERKMWLERMDKTIQNIEGKLAGVNADTKIKKLGNLNRKGLVSLSKGIVSNLKNGKNALQFLRITGIGAKVMSGGLVVLGTMALTIMTEGLAELHRRNLKARQAVMIVPLRYQGRNFTAGLNGVQGAVVGTKPGKMDEFWMGTGYGGDKDSWTAFLGKAINFTLAGDGLIGNTLNLMYGDPITGPVDYRINSGDPNDKGNSVDDAYNDR